MREQYLYMSNTQYAAWRSGSWTRPWECWREEVVVMFVCCVRVLGNVLYCVFRGGLPDAPSFIQPPLLVSRMLVLCPPVPARRWPAQRLVANSASTNAIGSVEQAGSSLAMVECGTYRYLDGVFRRGEMGVQCGPRVDHQCSSRLAD